MTWNSEGILCSGRELALLNLLTANDVNIGIITEAEIPASSQGDFNVKGYYSNLPHPSKLLKSAKYRVWPWYGQCWQHHLKFGSI
jgi:hypothetical protein